MCCVACPVTAKICPVTAKFRLGELNTVDCVHGKQKYYRKVVV